MNLNFSEEQVMLKETIQKFCDNDYDFYKREEVIKSENDFDLNTWNLFAEQGWLSMPFSETNSGGGRAMTALLRENPDKGGEHVLEYHGS